MSKWVVLLAVLCTCEANLEGPFLFFGPNSLRKYTWSALSFLDQDVLMKLYGEQAAIMVFNNQGPVPLSSDSFSRLRKLLVGQAMLVLPQDFLDVHPDYTSNDTQVLTVQGPWSERYSQMTETFAWLQDIYGKGRVLRILGNSVSQQDSADYDEWARVKRQAEDPTTVTATTEDERPANLLPKYALYNAAGPAGNGALMFSSGWRKLKFPNGTVLALDTSVGQPTIKPTRLYTILVVRFANIDNTRDKITLEFSFKQHGGFWTAIGVEVKRGLEATGLNLQDPSPLAALAAVLGKAYHCSLPLVYASEDAKLTLPDIRMQPYMESTEKFAGDFIGFTTEPIWSGLMVSGMMLLTLSICAPCQSA